MKRSLVFPAEENGDAELQKLVEFEKGKKRLSILPEVELSRPFGITSWNTTATLRNIRWEKVKE